MQKLIAKILNQAGLKPHKMECWHGKIPDPESEDKIMGGNQFIYESSRKLI
jgi:hypothetical protein